MAIGQTSQVNHLSGIVQLERHIAPFYGRRRNIPPHYPHFGSQEPFPVLQTHLDSAFPTATAQRLVLTFSVLKMSQISATILLHYKIQFESFVVLLTTLYICKMLAASDDLKMYCSLLLLFLH